MGMNPMSPKTPPPPAAFKLLDELNTFTARPLKERQAILKDYGSAAEQRATALEVINSDLEASRLDRGLAAESMREAEELSEASQRDAKAEARRVVGVANEQAESVNKTTAENVQKAKADTDKWGARNKKREDAVQEREDAQAKREADAFQARELAVTAREGALAEAEKVVKREGIEIRGLKKTYESLIEDIEALQRRAPK